MGNRTRSGGKSARTGEQRDNPDAVRFFCNQLALVSMAFALFICLQSFLKYQTECMEIRAYRSSASVLTRLSQSPISWQQVTVPFLSIAAAWLMIIPNHMGRDEGSRPLPPRRDDLRNRSRRYEIG